MRLQSSGVGVETSESRVQGLGFWVEKLEFKGWDLELRVWGLGFRVCVVEFRVQCSGFGI